MLADPAFGPWPELPPQAFLPFRVKAAWSAEELRLLLETSPDEEGEPTLALDPVGDLEAYFEFTISPAGAASEAVLRRVRSGYRKNAAWRCDGLRAAARRGEGGWTAELSIPFASLGSAARPCGLWRADVYRARRPPALFARLEFAG